MQAATPMLRLLPALFVTALAVLCNTGCERRSTSGIEDPGSAKPAVLRRGNGGDPGTLDPARAEDEHAFNVLADLYEGLVAIDAAGKLIPGVALSWHVSADSLIYRFQLDPEARWSNGEAVVADHFVTGLRRAASPTTASTYAFLLHALENAPQIGNGELPPAELGVTAIDPQTLELRLSTPAPELLAVLSMPIAYPLWNAGSPDIRQFSDPNHFVGNGAFLLESWRPGGLIRLVRNPRYRAAHAVKLDAVEYYPIAEPQTELNRFRAEELDLTATVPGPTLGALRENRTGELHVAPRLGVYYLAFDLSEAPLDDPALRAALTMAIDREQLTAVIGRGERPALGFVPDGVTGAKPARFAWAGLESAEREQRARQIFSERQRTAGPVRITLMYDAGDIHETVALAVAGMWRDVLGIDVDLDKREWKYFLDTREHRADWQAMRFAWTGDYDHPATFLDILRTANPQNLPGYSNPAYDDLVDAARRHTDPAEQARLFAEAERTMLADYPLAPLYFYVSKHLVSKRVAGFESNALDRHPSRFLSVD